MKLRVTIAGITYEAEVEVLEEEEAPRPYEPLAAPYAAAPQLPSIAQHETADNVCRSPVTGVVIRIAVQPGQSVAAGELLAVLEAMKMETQVMAPRAGSVEKIHVAAGASVKANQPLLEMDWEEAQK